MRGLSNVTVSFTLKIKVFLNGKLYDKSAQQRTRHVVESTNLLPRTGRVLVNSLGPGTRKTELELRVLEVCT